MKALLLASLLASATALVNGADAGNVDTGNVDTGNVNGSWKIHNSIAGNESDMSCNFTQKDKTFTGSCATEIGTVNLTGTVDDKKVNWKYKTEYNGGPLTLTYAGTLDAADKMTGKVTVEEYSVDGEFSAALTQ